MNALDAPSSDETEPAWSLFDDPEALQRALTNEVRANVAMNAGVHIPAEPAGQ